MLCLSSIKASVFFTLIKPSKPSSTASFDGFMDGLLRCELRQLLLGFAKFEGKGSTLSRFGSSFGSTLLCFDTLRVCAKTNTLFNHFCDAHCASPKNCVAVFNCW